jgi:hypothetical protein
LPERRTLPDLRELTSQAPINPLYSFNPFGGLTPVMPAQHGTPSTFCVNPPHTTQPHTQCLLCRGRLLIVERVNDARMHPRMPDLVYTCKIRGDQSNQDHLRETWPLKSQGVCVCIALSCGVVYMAPAWVGLSSVYDDDSGVLVGGLQVTLWRGGGVLASALLLLGRLPPLEPARVAEGAGTVRSEAPLRRLARETLHAHMRQLHAAAAYGPLARSSAPGLVRSRVGLSARPGCGR